MNAQQLKNSILQMAVQGKLVPQNPHDEPASVLVEKIKAEKNKLIKEKKIKPEKNPSFIFKGADNLPYEKLGDKVRCIADEVPFDIPESWEIIRLNEIGIYKKGPFGSSLTKSMFVKKGNNAVKVYEQKNAIQKNHELGDYYISHDYFKNKMSGFTVNSGDILVSCAGTIGETYIMPDKIELGIINQALMKMSIFAPINIDYFLLYFDYVLKNTAKESSKGSAIKNIPPFDIFKKLILPLPPLAEQERIVAKIEEIMPYVEKYGEKEDKLREINSNISKKLKQSILQEAVQGKLVEQDLNDEPASVLLEKIKAEKAQLIKVGKIKKDKNESYVFKRDNSHYEMLNGIERCIDEEIPFDIPDSWEWARLGNIVFNHGQMQPKVDFCYIDIGSINNKLQKLNKNDFVVSPKDAPSRARKIIVEGDILYSTVRPYLHNMCIVDRKFSKPSIASTGFAVMGCFSCIYNEFLFYYLLSPSFDSYANNTDNAKGVAYPAINDQRLYCALVPVPPILEQKRIVNKIKELLPFVDKCGKY